VGRTTFTQAEVTQLRALIKEKQTAERARQKTLRAEMRRIGFFISDFTDGPQAFVLSDLDELLSRGLVTIRDTEPDKAPKDI
jgi:hypothetical protein